MAVHWQIKFKSFLRTDYVVDIYDSGFSGTPVQLIGADSPFTTTEDNNEDMFVPIRTQSGYIRFVVESASIVNAIQPVKSTDRPVVLRSGNTIKWVGFLKPEMYSQPWDTTPYDIEIPLMSVMEAMQGVEFTQDEGYVSFYSLVRTINTYVPVPILITAPEETPVKDVFVQNNNFREFLTVAERGQRSTNDIYECQSIYEAVEAFCLYFGFSLHEYADTFFCIVYPNDSITYYDIDSSGNSRESQWGNSTLASMTICGADNSQNYSQGYRRIVGEFETGTNKMGTVLSIDNFFNQFSLNDGNELSLTLLFNGNAEIVPYKNGTAQVGWLADSTPTDTGGQIIRMSTVARNQWNRLGSSWQDFFYVRSYKNEAGTPESALKFNIPQCIYINSGENTVLNINANVSQYYGGQPDGFIKKLHCKVKVGNYWLSSTIPSGSTLVSYSWSSTECSCYLVVDNGGITMEGSLQTVNLYTQLELEQVSGFAIDMPNGLSAGYHEVYFELLANAESVADFEDFGNIGYLISGLEINVLRGVNSVTEPTPNFDTNTVIRKTNSVYSDDYDVKATITSKRGVQYGAGVALTSSKAYVTTRYDQYGIERRAAIMGKSREMLDVKVRSNQKPIDGVTYNGDHYGILSQSIDWRDDVNEMRIINLE